MALDSCDVEKSMFAEFRRIPVGGDQMVLGQLELRVALFKLFKNWLSLVAFTDAGANFGLAAAISTLIFFMVALMALAQLKITQPASAKR